MRLENIRQKRKYISKSNGVTYTVDHLSKFIDGDKVEYIVVFHKTGFYTAEGTTAMKRSDFKDKFEEVVEEGKNETV